MIMKGLNDYGKCYPQNEIEGSCAELIEGDRDRTYAKTPIFILQ
jgi:hypothetical protein